MSPEWGEQAGRADAVIAIAADGEITNADRTDQQKTGCVRRRGLISPSHQHHP